MKVPVVSATRTGRRLSAEASVVHNSHGDRYELIWEKRGKSFRIDLDAALAERNRIQKEKKAAQEAEMEKRVRAVVAGSSMPSSPAAADSES